MQEIRHSPYTPILLKSSDRRSRKRKSISWQTEDKLLQVHHFELIDDERVNVYRENIQQSTSSDADPPPTFSNNPTNPNVDNKGVASNFGAGVKMFPNSQHNNGGSPYKKARNESISNIVDNFPWRPLISIDYDPELPAPGWNSSERIAQAERENYVLGAIDLPGQPSTLDEPDEDYPNQISSGLKSNPPNSSILRDDPTNGNSSRLYNSSNNLDDTQSHNQQSAQTHHQTNPNSEELIIPLESAHGVYREYYDMYTTHIQPNYSTYQDFQLLINQSCQGLC